MRSKPEIALNQGKGMKRILLFVALFAASFTIKAQQDPQFTQWFNDKLSFNPASAGINNAHCLSAFYRTQWTGLEGQPKTAMFNYSGKVANSVGIGLNFYNDQLGQDGVFRTYFSFQPGKERPSTNGRFEVIYKTLNYVPLC